MGLQGGTIAALGGWLTGWPAGATRQPYGQGWYGRPPGTDGPDDLGEPESGYTTPSNGSLPPPVGPPAEGIVCFDYGDSQHPCQRATLVQAVSCGALALWELPPTTDFIAGYCLA